MATNGLENLTYNIKMGALVTGYNCWVRVGDDASSAQEVGFVDSMRASKNVQTQRANVCGSLLPVSIDPVSFSVQISLSGFMATKEVYEGTATVNGSGKVSLASFNPNDDDFANKGVVTKFSYIDFYDKKTGNIIAAFDTAISTAFNISVQGGSYAKADITLEALRMTGGSEYLA